MRIGELAKATGLSASRVRFYEKHGILPPPGQARIYFGNMTDGQVVFAIVRSPCLGLSVRPSRRHLMTRDGEGDLYESQLCPRCRRRVPWIPWPEAILPGAS